MDVRRNPTKENINISFINDDKLRKIMFYISIKMLIKGYIDGYMCEANKDTNQFIKNLPEIFWVLL